MSLHTAIQEIAKARDDAKATENKYKEALNREKFLAAHLAREAFDYALTKIAEGAKKERDRLWRMVDHMIKAGKRKPRSKIIQAREVAYRDAAMGYPSDKELDEALKEG